MPSPAVARGALRPLGGRPHAGWRGVRPWRMSFLVPHGKAYLLHAPLHGVTCLMSATTASELRQLLTGGESNGFSPRARRLAEDLHRANATVVPVRPARSPHGR